MLGGTGLALNQFFSRAGRCFPGRSSAAFISVEALFIGYILVLTNGDVLFARLCFAVVEPAWNATRVLATAIALQIPA